MENTVYIRRCEEYDREAISGMIADGARALGFAPAGNLFVKPNVVYAADPKKYGSTAYTHPTVVGAAAAALSRMEGVKRIDIGEKCSVGVPTRLCYKRAGYYKEVSGAGKTAGCPVGLYCIEEDRRDPVFVGGAVHESLRVSRRMARADAKIYLPKLKCHCVSRMTGAVKLNVGICCDDERSIRHDFLLDDKIVDLLTPGYPDFIVMDAIDVGVGNEAYPVPRRLGLLLMGRNPVAVDLVGARLLGLSGQDVPYLKRAMERGYGPASLEEVALKGDLASVDDLDREAKKLLPYDDEFYAWQDVEKELKRLNSPIRFLWGPYKKGGDRCLTGCVMGLKMFLASLEKCGGPEAFAKARPTVLVIGGVEDEIDADGANVYLLGKCADARLTNPGKVKHIRKCFTTASDMALSFGHQLGMPIMTRDPVYMAGYLAAVFSSMLRKSVNLRYAQDIGHFMSDKLMRRI